jgi:hypothetical protein
MVFEDNTMSNIALLHCSDLHIGQEPGNDQFEKIPLFRLANAHALPLGRGLREVVDDVAVQCGLGEDEDAYIVMSGDLTARGHAKEFVVAHSFLRSFWREVRSPENQLAGMDVRDSLNDSAPRLAAVSGNHDQWKGKSYRNNVGYNPNLKGTHFRATYWRRAWQSGELELELYGLDSNAGLSTTFSLNQRGQLDLSKNGEVDQLEAYLGKNQSPILPDGIRYQVRALVLHHSLASSGLRRDSRDRLLALAETYHIAAILTGHTHDFLANPMDTMPNKQRKVYELRSASTMQGPENRSRPSPGFLAHRIFVDGNRVRWKAWRYKWDSWTQSFAILSQDVANPFADFVAS